MPESGSNDPTIAPSQLPTESAAPRGRTPITDAHLPPGTVVSRYRIESVLGEGGMGAVYLARQEKPDRHVALKVVRPGYATEKMLRRFEMEAEVLGRLLHPGIAQIYEAGTADVGAGPQPFFAMELVKGVPLTQFALQNRLGTRDRLELVARVCDAVQHAHQKGIIHRDLKPGNVLVTDDGQPKILDFGVARATDADVQSTTLRTDIGQLIGTVPYMSPEQVGGDPADLDTRSDVYALGVVLYELLAGRLPYSLERRMIHEAARIIREEEPTRLSSIDRTLRGDIETIVAHALEKDKARRYGAASALAADIRRYLADEPIAARPTSTWYQLAKFSRRNKGLVAGVGAAFVLLILGVIGTGLALGRALRAESDLKLQLAETDKARKAEKDRADETTQVADFQREMLGQIDAADAGVKLFQDIRANFDKALAKSKVPDRDRAARVETLGQELACVNATDTAAEMIDRTILRPAVAAIDKQFKDQPVIDAALRQTLAGLYYRTLGRYEEARTLQEAALTTRRRVLGEEHPDTLVSLSNMSPLLQDQGKLAEAEMYAREALEKRRRALGEGHSDTLSSIINIGSLLRTRGKLTEAETYMREAVETGRRVLGEEHPSTLSAIGNLGGLLQAQGKLAEAETYRREVLVKSRRVLGEEHANTLIAINQMGFLLQAQGRLAEAEPLFREALEKRRRVLGEEHPATLTSISNMGSLRRAQGRFAEAETLLSEALEKRRRVLGEEHAETLNSIAGMGTLLRAQGKLAEAEPYYREALEKRRRVLGEESPDTLISINNMGVLLRSQNKLDQAEPYYREALEKTRRVLGEEHPSTLVSVVNMGSVLLAQNRIVEAIELLAPGEGAARKAFMGSNAGRLSEFLSTLGRSRAALPFEPDRFALAEANLAEAHSLSASIRGESHTDTRACARALVDLYTAWDKAEPGKGYDTKAAEWKAKLDADG